MIRFIRSLLFHIAYFVWNIVYPVLVFWGPIFPQRICLTLCRVHLRGLYLLERVIMGLDYRVIGRENLPAEGSYIIAPKHQSVWETLKLHLIFGDPAIILKRELMRIPIWGWYLARIGLIPVDRGRGGKALKSMLEGARKVAAEGRPIVIFPQGTRIAPGQWSPYRYGTAKLYAELGVPIVPVALNSGVFWGKNRFLKRSGTITVEILPPIPPGLSETEILDRLADIIEPASDRLVRAAGGPPLTWPGPGAKHKARKNQRAAAPAD